MGSNKKARVVLQFNEMDFRHRRALEILRQRPRSMSELVVSAILHYPQWKQGQITAVQCYKQLGISASTFYRLVRKYELEDESE